MQYAVQFFVDAPSQAAAQAARVAAEQAIVGAGCTMQGTSVGRRYSTFQVFGVVCDTGQRWQWRGEADDVDAAEAAALAERPASSRVAVSRQAL